jgi:hypothetical protein
MRLALASLRSAAALVLGALTTMPTYAQDNAASPRAPQAQLAQSPAHDPAECYCRALGRIFAVGESACLRTPGGLRLAECGMVLNNTSWRFTERPCPET